MVPSLIAEKYEKIDRLEMMNSKVCLKINNMGFFLQFKMFAKNSIFNKSLGCTMQAKTTNLAKRSGL